jgi:opacity protein-like surface antigen
MATCPAIPPKKPPISLIIMKKLFTALFLTALFVAPASAQLSNIGIGPRAGYDFDWESLFIGVDARAGVPTLPVGFNVSADYFFLEDVEGFGGDFSQSLIKITLNAIYEIGIDNQVFTPYVGAGLAIARYSADVDTGFGNVDASDTDLGLNVLGGAYFGSGSLRPFAQLYITTGGGTTVGAAGGVLFTI